MGKKPRDKAQVTKIDGRKERFIIQEVNAKGQKSKGTSQRGNSQCAKLKYSKIKCAKAKGQKTRDKGQGERLVNSTGKRAKAKSQGVNIKKSRGNSQNLTAIKDQKQRDIERRKTSKGQ